MAYTACTDMTYTACTDMAHTACIDMAYIFCTDMAYTACTDMAYNVCIDIRRSIYNGVLEVTVEINSYTVSVLKLSEVWTRTLFKNVFSFKVESIIIARKNSWNIYRSLTVTAVWLKEEQLIFFFS